MKEKEDLRKLLIEKRQKMPPEESLGKSKKIALSFLQAANWQAVKSVNTYNSIEKLNEVDTKLIQAAIHTTWPFIKLTVMPADKKAIVVAGSFDVIVVPVLGFDNSLNRLGMGGGFYDRFLALHPKALKIGLAYEFSRQERLPREKHDILLDIVITEEGVQRRADNPDKNR